jgi:hypothetical protein
MDSTTDSAMLAYMERCYPGWTIERERVWTATRRPTPTSLHFVYARSLKELEADLSAIMAESASVAS